jgi:hypothetical protein
MSPGRVTTVLYDPLLRSNPMLATSLQAAWYWGDATLRAELEASIRELVRRSPEMLPALKATLPGYWPPATRADARRERAGQLEGLLLTLWALGDPPLRADVEAMILGYAEREPRFATGFLALSEAALGAPRVIGARGEPETAAAALRSLLTRLRR